MPLLVTTLYFTFSRGAIAAGIVGLVAYVAIARPRALLSGLLATGPAAAIAVVVAYDADLLATANPTRPAAVDQGHDVALVVALCVVGAAAVRALLLKLDSRLRLRWGPPRSRSARRRVPLWPWSSSSSSMPRATSGTSTTASSRAAGQGNRVTFGAGSPTRPTTGASTIGRWRSMPSPTRRSRGRVRAPTRTSGRATGRSPSASGMRIRSTWRCSASSAWSALRCSWSCSARSSAGSCHVPAARTARLYAAVLAAMIVWLLHAGIDWDWEMPAVTLWVFALGGAALAAPSDRPSPIARPGAVPRPIAVLACFAVAVVPGLVLVSDERLAGERRALSSAATAPAAIDAADSSIGALATRPEPYEIRAFCRCAPDRAARQSARPRARRRPRPRQLDLPLRPGQRPRAAGTDPRPRRCRALRLNPLDPRPRRRPGCSGLPTDEAWSRRGRALLRGAGPFYLCER